MKQVIGDLERLRRRGRIMLIAQRASVVMSWALAVLLALVVLDFLLRLPSAIRLVMLVGGTAGLAYAVWAYLRLAIVFRPSLTQMALRVEGVMPAVSGRLASSVEFAMEGVDESNPLAARSVSDTQQRLRGESVSGVIRAARTWRDAGMLALVLAVTAAITMADPGAAGIGLTRVLLPYSATKWPARTGVESLMSSVVRLWGPSGGVHARGQALPLRAKVTRGPHDQRVYAHYRLRADGSFQPWQRIVLTHQGRGVHERLIDTSAAGADRVEVYFNTDDDETSPQRIGLVPPPAVRRASLTIAPPPYAAQRVPAYQAELGQGTDARSVTDTPSLIGSTATLRVTLNKPLPTPDPADAPETESWLRTTFGWGGANAENRPAAPDAPHAPHAPHASSLGPHASSLTPQPSSLKPQPANPAPGLSFAVDPGDPATWILQWPIAGTHTIAMRLVDEHGLSNFEPISFRIEGVEDRLPAITISNPQADQVVLPTAVVELETEARDDVALSSVGLEARVQGDGPEYASASAETAPPDWHIVQQVDQPIASVRGEIELARLRRAPAAASNGPGLNGSPDRQPQPSAALREGDVVLVSGVAQDVYDLDGARHEPVRSSVRRLRVISEIEFATQLRRQLSTVRQNAIRIEAQQAELQDDIAEGGVPPGAGLDRAQAQLSERIAAQRQSVQDIGQLMRQNRMNDPQLSEVLRQSQDLLDAAGRAANRAVEGIQRQAGASPKPQDDAAPAQGDQPAPAGASPKPQDNAVPAPGNQPTPGDASPKPQDDAAPAPGDQPAPGSTSPAPHGNAVPAPGNQPTPGGASPKPQDNAVPAPGNQPAPGTTSPAPHGNAAPAQPSPADSPALRPDSLESLPEDRRDIVEAQQEVREELTDLIKLLDRDEDTWVVKRQLEDLLAQQAKLQAAAARLGEQTVGLKPQELSPPQRSEAERIARLQREMRDEAQQLIDDLRQRSEALQPVDPHAAEGMRSAADTAEQQQLARDMESAAQQVQQNQMTSAGASQQRSQSTMQRMLQQMQETRRAQAQQLLRQLASLVESIQRLVVIQEGELTALALAREADTFAGLDRSMIRLNQNTQAVAVEARSAGQEARRIARTLDRAADSQGAAVVALRDRPIRAEDAQNAENRSLELLNEARKLALDLQKQAQDEETQRRREELIEQYRKFAEQQVALRGETLELSGVENLDRRQLVEARRLGAAQDQVRTGLNELRDRSSEVLESPIFLHVHRSMDVWSSQISEALIAGRVDVDVTDQQRWIADSIGRLIEALEESLAPPDEFASDQQGDSQGGQSQQQQPVIPPGAQLKLLKGLQEQVYNRTRDIDGRSDLDAGRRRTRLRELGQQQREIMELGRQLIESLQPGGMPPNEPGGEPRGEPRGEPVEPMWPGDQRGERSMP